MVGQEVVHIADNSFLIEEAYNQEAGVVQHISNFVRDEAGDGWVYVFTQEWPLGGMRHQLSYTVPVVSPEGFGTGLGDILLNYRYQAVGDGVSALHVAPRLSLVLPTGSEENGRGSGSVGIQGNLPVSYEVNNALVVHSNTGFVLDGESGALDARPRRERHPAGAALVQRPAGDGLGKRRGRRSPQPRCAVGHRRREPPDRAGARLHHRPDLRPPPTPSSCI